MTDYLATLTVLEQIFYAIISAGLAIDYFVHVFRTRGTTFQKLVGLLYPANLTVGLFLWRAAEISISENSVVSVVFIALVLIPVILLLFKVEYLKRIGII